MTVKGVIPIWVLSGLKRILKDHPNQLTVLDLAQQLDVSNASMYRYMKLLNEVGVVEPGPELRAPRLGGPWARLWRWTR